MKRILLISLLFASASLLQAQITTLHNAQPVTVTLLRVSLPLKDLPVTPVDLNGKRSKRDNPSLEHKAEGKENKNAKPVGPDPAWQKSNSRSSSTAINVLSAWEGIAANVDPSDNCMAVGPNHVVQMTNTYTSTYLRVWNKAGDLLFDHITVESITGLSDYGDPNIIYDQASDRWAFVVLDGFSNKLIVCVSQTPDPSGSYNVYDFATAGGFPDYPKIAVWGNSYFITTNSNSPTVWALNKAALLAGDPIGTAQQFSLESFGTIGFQSASPVNFTGSIAAPADQPAIMMRVADDAWSGIAEDHLEIFLVSVDWTDMALSTITGNIDIATIPYNSDLCGFNAYKCIPEPGASNKKLDPLSNIIMDKAQYINLGDHESIVCSHVCNADGDGTAGVRWYELRKNELGDWYAYQQGTWSPDGDHRWMSSITMNQFGTIALGYNISSTSTYPGLRMTGRAECDSLNLMTAAETSGQEGSATNSSYRYGDYNGMVSDPVDGSFWFTANYNHTADWATKVIHFTIDSCRSTTDTSGTNSLVNLSISDFRLVPIPASAEVEVSFGSSISGNASVQVIDLSGQMVMEQKMEVQAGYNKTVLNVRSISNGYYILRLTTPKGTAVENLVIQH